VKHFKKEIHRIISKFGVVMAAALFATTALAAEPDLASYQQAERLAQTHIATFDTLDSTSSPTRNGTG
jgi:hypothetical protein